MEIFIDALALIPDIARVPFGLMIMSWVGYFFTGVYREKLGGRAKFLDRTSLIFFWLSLVILIILIFPALSFAFTETISVIFPSGVDTPQDLRPTTPVPEVVETPEVSYFPPAWFWLIIAVAFSLFVLVYRRRQTMRFASVASVTDDEMQSSLFAPDADDPSVHRAEFDQYSNWGDFMYKAVWIRLDGIGDCREYRAILSGLWLKMTNNERAELSIDEYNPKGLPFDWGDDDNRCLLTTIYNFEKGVRFYFEKNNRSKDLDPGSYDIEIEISKNGQHQYTVIGEFLVDHRTRWDVKCSWQSLQLVPHMINAQNG